MKNNLRQKHIKLLQSKPVKNNKRKKSLPASVLSCSAVTFASHVKCSITAPRYVLQGNFVSHDSEISCVSNSYLRFSCELRHYITGTRGFVPTWSHQRRCGVPQGWPAHWVWVVGCLLLIMTVSWVNLSWTSQFVSTWHKNQRKHGCQWISHWSMSLTRHEYSYNLPSPPLL